MKKEANQMCIIVTLFAVPMVSAREEALARLKLHCGRPVPVFKGINSFHKDFLLILGHRTKNGPGNV